MPASQMPYQVIAIVGPTASAKTALSIELAKHFNSEIIACDSRTVYKKMDIGTAKPSMAERQGVEHRMFDLIEPNQTYSVSRYRNEANLHIQSLVSKQKPAIVCGGTGFYLRALLEGLCMPDVVPQEDLRDQLNTFADNYGNEAIHNRLKSVDKESADKININDRFRIIRALEVYETLGIPFSQAAIKTDPPYRTIWLGMNAQDRGFLYKRIEARMEVQIQAGLIAEIESLIGEYGKTSIIKNSVCYKEFLPYIEGKSSLEESKELCNKNTRNLARKQLIWFRQNPKINWLYLDEMPFEDLVKKSISLIENTNA